LQFSSGAAPIVSPQNFGALGNGSGDDYIPLHYMLSSVCARGGHVMIPSGPYQIGRATGRTPLNGAIELAGCSHITVEFQGGAYLKMNNLNGTAGDQAHGIFISNGANHIRILHADVRWVTTPSRSRGAGVYILGDFRPSGIVHDVDIENAYVFQTAEAGIQIIGARDVTVRKFRADRTGADGINVNACYGGIVISDVDEDTPGDDAVGLTTYYGVSAPPYLYGKYGGPLTSPDQVTRNDNGVKVSNVVVKNGKANGVTLAGTNGASVSGVTCLMTRGACIQAISARPGGPVTYPFLAPVHSAVSNVVSVDCAFGLLAISLNGSYPAGSTYTDFHSTFTDFEVHGTTAGGSPLQVSTVQYVTVGDFTSYGSVSHATLSLKDVRNSIFSNVISEDGPIRVSGSGSTPGSQPDQHLTLTHLKCDGCGIFFGNASGINAGLMESYNAPKTGVEVLLTRNVDADRVIVRLPNRAAAPGASGIAFLSAQGIKIGTIDLYTDTTPLAETISIGNGSASTPVSSNIRIGDYEITTGYNSTSSGIVVQSGTYAAKDIYFRGKFYNSGVSSPAWQDYSRPEPIGSSGPRVLQPR
jgi:hypothetical protein